MTRLCLSLLAILAVATAFTSPIMPKATSTSAATKPLYMFSGGDDKPSAAATSPLSEVKPGETADTLLETTQTMESSSSTTTTSSISSNKPTMTVKNRNTGELMEVEMNESFLANEKMEMGWWAWAGFVILPITLLSNDVFHFLPTEGPLGFLGRL